MKIAVLGGGISGLVAAWNLVQRFPQADITLHEKSDRLGGYLKTDHQQGMIFEQGARTFRTASCPALLRLIREINLEKELIFSKTSGRYLWHKEALRSMRSLLIPHFWRLFLEPFVSKASEEESVYAFFKRRLGSKAADLFADPFCLGIFAGESRMLSMNACFPKMLEQRSLLFTPPSTLFSLRHGMQTLIETLEKKLPITIHLNSEITSLNSLSADAIFSALPIQALSQLVPSFPKITCASLSVVNMGFSQHFPFPYQGYGYLAPKQALMGMIWDSNIFPQQKGVRLTAMIRQEYPHPEEIALKCLRTHLKIDHIPDLIQTVRMEQAIPQLSLGHLQRLQAWKNPIPHLYIMGNFLSGPAVEQCILQAEQAVNKFSILN